jgi:hypothetical protein
MLDLRLLDRTDSKGRPLFKLLEDYAYPLGIDTYIVVPKGYITNFGTIPRFCYWVITPAEMREAAVVHDFLCNEDFTIMEQPLFSGVPRRVADAILYDHLRRIGIDIVRANLIYAAVRAWEYFPKVLK